MRQDKSVKSVCAGREEGQGWYPGSLHCRGATKPANETEMRPLRRKGHQASVVFWVPQVSHLETLLI